MRAWIFSDLHITDAKNQVYSAFLNALKEANTKGDHLVLAGDIYDLMVGSSHFYRTKFKEFFEVIEAATSAGVQVHYIEGNHDFHIRGLYPKNTDFQEEAVILIDCDSVAAKKLLYIAHGDLVEEGDTRYLQLRSVLRSTPFQVFTSLLPGKVIETVGSKFSRSLGQKATDEASPHTRALFRAFAAKKHDEGFDYVVLGHCHDFDALPPFYFNMGFPPRHGYYLYYDGRVGLERRPLSSER